MRVPHWQEIKVFARTHATAPGARAFAVEQQCNHEWQQQLGVWTQRDKVRNAITVKMIAVMISQPALARGSCLLGGGV